MHTTAHFRPRGLAPFCLLLVLFFILGLVTAAPSALARNNYRYTIDQEGDPGDGVLQPATRDVDPEVIPEPRPLPEPTPERTWRTPFVLPLLWFGPAGGPGINLLPPQLIPSICMPAWDAVEGRCHDAP